MSSVAAMYRLPDEAQSPKQRAYTLDELKRLVYYSGAPHSVRAGTLAALDARGAWPRGDGPASTIICVSLVGMKVEGGCCRSTAQRRVKRAVSDGFWRETRGANTWTDCPQCGAKRKVATCAQCGKKGDPKNFDEFRRPSTYELDVEKFVSQPRCREIHSVDWRTYKEYKEAAKRGEQSATDISSRKPTQPAPDNPPPTTSAPIPERAKPAAKSSNLSNSTNSTNSDQRKPLQITRAVRMTIAGCYSNARKQGKDVETAIRETCEALSSETHSLSESDVRLQLKIWQGQNGSLEPPPPPPEIRCHTCSDQRLVLNLNNGPGEKRLIPCPKCGVQSP
jgi:hypothetical protein